MNHKRRLLASLFFAGQFLAAVTTSLAADNKFAGYWALHLPGGGAGWLNVSNRETRVDAQMLWSVGSVFKLNDAKLVNGELVMTRLHFLNSTPVEGTTSSLTETITASTDGADGIKLITVTPKADGGEERAEFSGHRQSAPPPAPDLSRIQFGPPIQLFNGTNLAGWEPVESSVINGWHADQGLLVNTVKDAEPGKPELEFANLRTVAEFEDFSLHVETCLAKNGNSGVYIRGTDEVQIFDSYGKPLNSHNMGAIYSRITPTAAAEKPAGEWQTVDILYVARHVTVVLNGIKIIDNQPVLGPTGGALWPEMDRPGPIYLQGDHTGIEYRNLVLRRAIGN